METKKIIALEVGMKAQVCQFGSLGMIKLSVLCCSGDITSTIFVTFQLCLHNDPGDLTKLCAVVVQLVK